MKYASLCLSVLTSVALSSCAGTDDGSQNSSSSSSLSSAVTENADIHVDTPDANAVVKSPLTISGNARGTWYFEASFPVKLLDGNGNQIAIAPAQAQGDWMTTNFVPFTVTLTFVQPQTATGTLVLEKDNPSGLPEHAASISIPVSFQ